MKPIRVALAYCGALALVCSGCGAEGAETDDPVGATSAAAAALAPGASGRGGPPGEFVGELQMAVIDYLDGSSETELELLDPASGATWRLEAFDEESLPGNLRHGARVRVRGWQRNGAIALAARGAGGPNGAFELLDSVAAAAVTGTRRVLVVLADFIDAPLECSPASVEEVMFSPTYSVDGLYREISSGTFGLSGTVVGPFPIAVSSTDTCEPFVWASSLDGQLAAAGYDLSSYDHLMYAFPRSHACSYAGIARLGGKQAVTLYCGLEDIWAHELGHNLGMHHAGSARDEYGDPSDFMGYSGYPLRQINAPRRISMGWIDPARVVDVAGAGVYTLAPLEFDSNAAGPHPQVLKMRKPDTGQDYFLSYRQPIGYDTGLMPHFIRGLSLHTQSGARTTMVSLLASDFPTFADPQNAVTITQLGSDPSGLTVQIDFNDALPPSAPTGLKAASSKKKQVYEIALTWKAATDNVGVAGYTVSRDGVEIANTTSLSFVDGNIVRGRTYRYTVRAEDLAGNQSAESSPVTIKFN